jgi:hypothetical protein
MMQKESGVFYLKKIKMFDLVTKWW